ncbi:MAG: amidase, partial [Cyanobacteria bacterium P01_G01_bin.38]
IILEVAMQPLPQTMLHEWVVLSTHRSFESAEDRANRWKAAGSETEVAQPNSWQVWAKRDVYSTPL